MDSNDYKIGTEMRLALGTDYETRTKALDLNSGYAAYQSSWEIIVKYIGDLNKVAKKLDFTYIELMNYYAIIHIRESAITALSYYPEILYMDKPKQMYLEQITAKMGCTQSCMRVTHKDSSGNQSYLTGKGVLVAILDSGIDYKNSLFINEDGSSKILFFWDQTIDKKAPFDYKFGTEYTKEDLAANELSEDNDTSGHGTMVASIVAACAKDASYIVVKLAQDINSSQCKTTSLICAIDYVIRVAQMLQMPIAINISYGNFYGDHAGNSILESYIDSVSENAKLSIVVGTGNDGNTSRHARLNVNSYQSYESGFIVEQYEMAINLQIWYSFLDDISVSIITPDGIILGPFEKIQPVAEYELSEMTILVVAGYPSQINKKQELYISIVPKNTYITAGLYTIVIRTRAIVDGIIDLWLPVANSTNTKVTFINPDPAITLTIPSSAKSVISVGAYDVRTERYANFSGRGFDADGNIKPDICAPGVQIQVIGTKDEIIYASGTSFATPYVTAAAALLMQWGIYEGNDPFLFGQKLKAYLIKGARPLIGNDTIPNEKTGYGALCVENSLNL